MATQLQLRRGTTSENGSFTGALGEVTVDTDKDTLVVHDGSTAGGHEMAKNDGSNMTAIDVGDNVQLKMGAGDDLLIYHDSLNSYIKDGGTGNLRIQGADITLQDPEGNGFITMVDSGTGGTVYLKHSGSNVLSTTSSGVDVTGDIAVSGNIITDGLVHKDDSNTYVKFLPDRIYMDVGGQRRIDAEANSTKIVNEDTIKLQTGSSITDGLVINAAQNVSIPSGNLDVTGTVTADSGSYTSSLGGNSLTFSRNGDNNIIAEAGTSANLNIKAGNKIVSTADSYHAFNTGSGAGTEAMRLDSSQNVSIPNGDLSVGGVGSIGTSSGDLAIFSTDSGHEGLRFGNGAIVPTNNSGGTTDNACGLGTATGRFSDLHLAGGVYLGGTAAGNKLDYYEEGTWTPTINGATSGSITGFSLSGNVFTRVGETVTCHAYITSIDESSSDIVGTIYIGGLPFSRGSLAANVSISYCNFAGNTSGEVVQGYVNGQTIILYKGSSTTALSASDITSSANTLMMISVTYQTNG